MPAKWNKGFFRRGKRWEFFITDEHGRRSTRSGYVSLELTKKYRTKIEDEIRQKRLGMHDPRRERMEAAQSQGISETIDEFEKIKNTPKISQLHLYKLMRNIRECVAVAGFKRAVEITHDRTGVAVENIRKEREWSHESANQMIKAMRQFCHWLADSGMIQLYPLKGLNLYPAQSDRHHDRRGLTDVEITKLFNAAIQSKRHAGGGPMEKYLCCRTALESGFRADELRVLDKSRFVLDGLQIGIRLHAGEDKAKRGVIQPISRELAKLLKEYFASIPDRPNILHVPDKTGQMMKRLCKRAGVHYQIKKTYADFHAWRHTFISRLANANPPVPLPIVQLLARHSSITTTMRYVHTSPASQRDAVNGLGKVCAALALAADGEVRQMLASHGTGSDGERIPNLAKEKDKNMLVLPGNIDKVSKCARQKSNLQPLASEAKHHPRARHCKKKS